MSLEQDDYAEQLEKNKGSIGLITIFTFMMIYGNGISILYLIYIYDAIANKNLLNDDVLIYDLVYSIWFYTIIITITSIGIVSSHIYGYRNILKCYISFVPSYYMYICLLTILFLGINILWSDNPCKSRVLLNCSLVLDESDLSNDSIIDSINILVICECVSIMMVILLSAILDRRNFCKMVCLNIIVGVLNMILPLLLLIIMTCGGGLIDCGDNYHNHSIAIQTPPKKKRDIPTSDGII